MAKGRHPYKLSDAKRLMLAAVAAGFKVHGIQHDPRDDKITVLVGDGPTIDADKANPWDEVLTDDDPNDPNAKARIDDDPNAKRPA